ncbi:helix-turn-helix transcriptional regulator [Lentzea sp. NPDC060358]|uniref:helix-turn-helix transcriptional regulator n=1 Tax=Lentzea sp. NPDC060358 TaxID=3347103 RepID=UPI0036696F0E
MQSVERVCAQDRDSVAVRVEVAARLARVIPHDAYCFATVDPRTLLLTGEVSQGIPHGSASVAVHNEYLVEDVDKFADLARSRHPVGILGLSTGGEPGRSHRFRTVLPLIEAGDEMRVVFLADGRCWGALSLFRGRARPGFTPRDGEIARSVTRTVAKALRRAAVRRDLSAVTGSAGPGVLVLDARDEVVVANDAAERWAGELSAQRLALHEVAGAARAGRGADACIRVRSRDGQWLSVRGSTVDGAGPGGVSVVIQPATSSDVTSMLVLGHALTAREREVLQHVIAGTPAPAIATELRVSVHTVESHLKSLCAKAGVSGRKRLVSQFIGQLHGL